MGFLNLARDMISEHGKTGLMQLRKTGKIIAPGITRRISKGVHKNRRLIRSVGKVVDSAVNVADAASVGDLAGGLHAGVHLGQTAQQLFMDAKGKSGGSRPFGKGLQTKPKRPGSKKASGGSALEQFDSGAANDPKISGDLLARMTKSTRSS